MGFGFIQVHNLITEGIRYYELNLTTPDNHYEK